VESLAGKKPNQAIVPRGTTAQTPPRSVRPLPPVVVPVVVVVVVVAVVVVVVVPP